MDPISHINSAIDALEHSRPDYVPEYDVKSGEAASSSPQTDIAGCDTIINGWFSEISTLWPGQALSLEIEEVLHHEKTEFQDLLVFRSKAYGNVLVLDGAIQATERDEFSYQEMIAHLPMCGHPNPKRVLVIGGGDGGVLRELSRHACLEEIVICELDRAVPAAAKRWLPSMAAGFDDPRVTLHYMDGALFMEQHQEYFDIIITDSSDPVGPACVLFEKPFYEKMGSALRAGGVVCTQGESLWLHLSIIKEMMDFCQDLFVHVEYAYCTIPTYPSGQIGFVICSKGESCKAPSREFLDRDLRYYNADVHRAAFVLPEFARRELMPAAK